MSAILDRYTGGGRLARLYRRLRLRHGGFDPIADLLPRARLIVDLGYRVGMLAHVLLEGSPGRRVLAVDHDEDRHQQREHAEGRAAAFHRFTGDEVVPGYPG